MEFIIEFIIDRFVQVNESKIQGRFKDVQEDLSTFKFCTSSSSNQSRWTSSDFQTLRGVELFRNGRKSSLRLFERTCQTNFGKINEKAGIIYVILYCINFLFSASYPLQTSAQTG